MKAFTLIETLVAILILTVAITGPLTIASRGLNAALLAKDQTTAFYLAQDGAEYVRSVRDSNRIMGDDWLTGAIIAPSTVAGVNIATVCEAPPNGSSANGCAVDALTANISACSSSGCTDKPLYYNSTSHQYTLQSSNAAKTIFTRSIVITPVLSFPDEVQMVVTVSWKDVGSTAHSVVVRDDLFNWQ